MRARTLLNPRALEHGPRAGSGAFRYGFAVVVTLAAAVVWALVLAFGEEPVFAPLVAAAAVSVWYGGLGPGVVSVVLGWGVGLVVLLDDDVDALTGAETWGIALASALVVVGVATAIRRGHERAASAVDAAERSRERVERLQALASRLSAAATRSEVALALVDGASALLGARGGSVGLIDGDALEIVDPQGGAERQMLEPGLRLPLDTRAPITTAARTGRPVWAARRDAFEREYPDGARLAPYAAGALAVPFRAGERVIGSIGFPFERPDAVDEGLVALAQIAADLGGQALERAGLYESERESRAGLDRILRVAPRFQAGASPREVLQEVCREARATFGADVAQVWVAADAETFEVAWREPAREELPPGTRFAWDDYPGLREALAELRPMFIADSPHQVRGRALVDARVGGIRSSFRVPIVVGGRAERLLVLQWQTPVSEPDPGTAALVRRFADQAGLAVEAAERRLAEREAARAADETRRLLDVTAALAASATVQEVADAIVREARRHLAADGAVVVLPAAEDEELLQAVRHEGLGELERSPLRTFRRDDRLPLADAVRRNELVVVGSREERDKRYPALRGLEPVHGAWLAVPLALGGRAVGALGLGFPAGRRFPEADLEFANALARQAAQAVERARLLDAEHRARERAERTAGTLAQLHALGTALARAVTPAEVARAVGAQLVGVLGSRSAALYALADGGDALRLLGGAGELERDAYGTEGCVPLGSPDPPARAVRGGEVLWLDGDGVEAAPDGARAASLAAVPLTAGGQPIGALVVAFEPRTRLDEGQRRLVETVGRQAAEPLARARLLDAERRSRQLAERAGERTRRLQAVAEALAAAPSTSEVAETAVRESMAALGGDGAAFYALADGALELLAAHGYPQDGLEAWRRVPRDADAPVADAVRAGELLVLPSRAALLERYPALGDVAEQLGERAGVAVPLRLGAKTLGGLYVSFSRERELDGEELAVVLTLARQCAVALERASLTQREQAAAERMRRLQAVTAALSQAATPREVSATCLELGAAAVGAHGGVVAVLTDEGDALELVGALGYAADELEPWLRIPLDAEVPVSQAVRLGEPVWALDEASVRGYEELRELAARAGDRAWVALPLTAGAGPRGALLLAFGEPRRLSAEERDWLVALAGQCAQALDRSRLYEDERRSRRRSERLQAMTAALTGLLTQREVASVLLDQSIAAFDVDVCLIALYRPETNELECVVARGVDEDEMAPWLRYSVSEDYPGAEAFRHRSALVLDRDGYVGQYPRLADSFAKLGIETISYFPLYAGGRGMGVAVFAWHAPRALDADELAFFETLASQAAQALDRAQRYEAERSVAETLQRSVLPDRLPEIEGLELAARYLPGTAGVEVGGDWFDVITLDRGRVGLVVGDVVGKGVRAAATMGQLRNGLRAFALEQLRPSSVVTRVNRLLDSLADAPFATLAYLTVDPRRRVLRYTLAGHPPPVLLRPDGTAGFLEGARSLPLGVGGDVDFAQEVLELEPGSTVVLYTDGLVERRDSTLDEGLERLRASVAAAPREPEALVDAVIADCIGDVERSDDVAVLAFRLAERPVADLELRLPADPASLVVVRDELRGWLAATPATESEASDVVLAAWEACANAVEHAQSPVEGTFAVEASRVGDSVRVQVRDSGRWLPQEERPDRGLGLVLMRSLVDRLDVAPGEGEAGTVVTLQRRIGGEG